MTRAKIELGIQIRKIKRADNTTCARCDRALTSSEYNGKPIVFRRTRSNYLCVRCAVSKSKSGSKPHCTISDIDAYLNKLLGGTN